MQGRLVGLAAFALLAAPAALPAQVVADIGIVTGPVNGRVVVGAPVYREVVAVPVTEYVVVERWVGHVPRGRAHGWWRRNGYRPVTLWYDGYRYYHRPWRRGLVQVPAWAGAGHYYQWDDGRDGPWDGYGERRWDDRDDDRPRGRRERYRDWDD